MAEEPTLKRIAQGREAEIFAWEDGSVLRLLRQAGAPGRLEREAAAMEAVRLAGLPVPRVLGLTEQLGRPGMIMERVDGPDLLMVFSRKPWTLWSGSRVCGELHARVNAIEAPETLPALGDEVRRKIMSSVPSELARTPLMLLDELPGGDRICHGDYHPGNVLMTAAGPMIIDWPNAARGNPDADFARTVLLGRLGEPPPGASFIVREGTRFFRGIFRRAYLKAYTKVRPVDGESLRRWQIVRAADRIAEGVESERPALEAILRAAADE
ncbi:MAG: phosphotransferase [Dehalococcoidia bacterium]